MPIPPPVFQPPPQRDILPWLERRRYQLTDANPWLRTALLWGRHHGFRPNAVFLCEYPKSGGTWLRFMLHEILTTEPSEFRNVNHASRMVGYHFRAPDVLPGGGRLIATHETWRPAYHKVLYLVRDVRDVALSHYRREWHMGVVSTTFDAFLLCLMNGPKRHGSWPAHVASYLDSGLARTDRFLLLRFEDLRRNTAEVLTRIVDFLGARPDREAINRAVQNNSLEAMRAKEDRVHALDVRVRMSPPGSSREEGRFVHKGEVEGWRRKLSAAQLDLIERLAGQSLLRLGYPLSLADQQSSAPANA
jgi:hypothetical protein